MIDAGVPTGMALQIEVDDISHARGFYSTLFGRPPDFAPHEDFLEWRVTSTGEAWCRVVEAAVRPRPLQTRVRFAVPDVHAAAEQAQRSLGVMTSTIMRLPDVVAFTDFEDPWGNRLGYYQDLLPSGEQPTAAASVREETQYEVDARDQ